MGDVVGLVGEEDGGVAVLEGAVDRGAAEVELRARAGPVQHGGGRRRRLPLPLRLRLGLHAASFLQRDGVLAAIIGRHSRPADWIRGISGAATNRPPACRLPLEYCLGEIENRQATQDKNGIDRERVWGIESWGASD